MTIIHISRADKLEQAFFDLYKSPLPKIAVNENGKPDFVVGGVHFAKSHSGEYVVYAFSDGVVGVDIEKRRKVNFTSITNRYFPLETAGDEKAFFDLWTRKEADIKRVGGTVARSICKPPDEKCVNLDILDGYSLAISCNSSDFFFHFMV